jgi:hypothetical protein
MSTCALGGSLLLLQLTLARAQPVQYEAVKGKIRIEGTSNIDDWQVETKSVAGHFKAEADFPVHVSGAVADRKKAPETDVLIDVRSLRSVEKDGKPFSNLMDEIMYAKLKAPDNPRIRYRLTHLKLIATPKGQGEPFRFECDGELAVAGVTNQITMPINILRLDGQRLRIWGNIALRMTDFRIEPPAPKIALGVVKTGDEVKISFDWTVAARGQSHSGETTGTLPR